MTRKAPHFRLRLVHTHSKQDLRAMLDERETPRASTDNVYGWKI